MKYSLAAFLFLSASAHWTLFAQDSLALDKAFSAVYDIEQDDPDRAFFLYDSLGEVSKTVGYLTGIGKSWVFSGILHNQLGNYEESIRRYQLGLPYYVAGGYQRGEASVYNNTGVNYLMMDMLDSAIVYFVKAAQQFEAIGDTSSTIIINGNIGALFVDLGQFDRVDQYARKNLALARTFGDSTRLSEALTNMGLAAAKLERFEEAEERYRESLLLGIAMEEPVIIFLGYNNLADLYYLKDDPAEALKYSRLALQKAREVGNPYHLTAALRNMGLRYVEVNEPDSAIQVLEEVIAYGSDYANRGHLADAHLYLSDAYERKGFWREALGHSRSYLDLQKEIRNERQDELVNDMERRYQTEKKDRELAEQELLLAEKEAQSERQRAFLWASASSILILLLLGFMAWRHFRQKQRIARERFLRVQQEQALAEVKARLEGEERERRRLARELHDGIGGQLAVIRSKMRSGGGADDLARDLANTDTEVRRIAHNLMPEILLKHGLKQAIASFAEQCDGHPYPVHFQFHGSENGLLPEKALAVYRVTQELVKNAIKHASPSNIWVQLMISDEELHLSVEDDGKGMPQAKDAEGGAGQMSVRERLDAIGGNMNVESSAERGTAVTVTAPMSSLKDEKD